MYNTSEKFPHSPASTGDPQLIVMIHQVTNPLISNELFPLWKSSPDKLYSGALCLDSVQLWYFRIRVTHSMFPKLTRLISHYIRKGGKVGLPFGVASHVNDPQFSWMERLNTSGYSISPGCWATASDEPTLQKRPMSIVTVIYLMVCIRYPYHHVTFFWWKLTQLRYFASIATLYVLHCVFCNSARVNSRFYVGGRP